MFSFHPRRNSIWSRLPIVVMRPVTAPFISMRMLSPVVVPCTIWSVRPSRPSVSNPSASARSAMPRMTPSDWSAGVEAVLVKVMEPSGLASTKSVKVPPTSMPMR